MSATNEILATYRAPGRVMHRKVAGGVVENRSLIYLMIGCLMMFVAQLPRLARQAHLNGEDLQMLMGGTLMAWMFIAPLVFYVLGGLAHLVVRAFGRKQSAAATRMALFWALLAASPLVLLWGLTAGFIGPGPAMTAVGAIWAFCFFWFWIMGTVGAGRAPA